MSIGGFNMHSAFKPRITQSNIYLLDSYVNWILGLKALKSAMTFYSFALSWV